MNENLGALTRVNACSFYCCEQCLAGLVLQKILIFQRAVLSNQACVASLWHVSLMLMVPGGWMCGGRSLTNQGHCFSASVLGAKNGECSGFVGDRLPGAVRVVKCGACSRVECRFIYDCMM